MSKASEYAKGIREAENLSRPQLRASISGDWVARVLNSGNLDLLYRAPMTPDLALALADWIYATFGEPTAPETET